ncbi:hypothetical protein J8273_4611 [Carpediemonas membranifera]|uniref:Uncharacterized protein n=1 Tax=Carpediemonas membranifera TaxID=201153 RepID=A0A8J6BY07_9EUKA|nr:hypothetical protein J8273_4611 [Carpediemonas membranifera]|eukprot:KAG9394011.1 hypothetical protein J8273_4611 [Carpediemonas membranifera]
MPDLVGDERAAENIAVHVNKFGRNPFLHSIQALLVLITFSFIVSVLLSSVSVYIYSSEFLGGTYWFYLPFVLVPVLTLFGTIHATLLVIWTVHLQRRYTKIATLNLVIMGFVYVVTVLLGIVTIFATNSWNQTVFFSVTLIPIVVVVVVVPLLLAPCSIVAISTMGTPSDGHMKREAKDDKKASQTTTAFKRTLSLVSFIAIQYASVGAGVGIVLAAILICTVEIINYRLLHIELLWVPFGVAGLIVGPVLWSLARLSFALWCRYSARVRARELDEP